ncbi:MAG: hypothetical protein FWG58_01720 [Methanomassiliicoccaceae archaeon]|nr:hypothetical protein [Methanomassiliicoccaceae archaeon]
MDWMEFLTIIVFVFAIVMIVAGVFAAYFGRGKSRLVGLTLVIIGIVVGLVWWYLVTQSNIELFSGMEVWDLMREALINIIAALIGALVAVGIFLVAVMKS